jgi:hypothetical protein
MGFFPLTDPNRIKKEARESREREDREEELAIIDVEIKRLLLFMEMEVLAARRELECGDGWLSDHYERLGQMDGELQELIVRRKGEKL